LTTLVIIQPQTAAYGVIACHWMVSAHVTNAVCLWEFMLCVYTQT